MTPKPSSKNELAHAFRKAGPYLNIGYTLLGGILLFGYLGHLVDGWLNKNPIFLLLGLFLGLAAGFYNMFKVLRQLDRE